jgi:membrane protease YdiL (CAAX protease family)
VPEIIHISRQKLLIMAFLSEGLALLIAFILGLLFDIDLFQLPDNALHDIVTGTMAALIPFLLFILLLSSRAETFPLLRSLKRTMLTQVRPLFANARLIDLVVISLIAGIAEEMLFRGIVQVKFGIITASVVFGLAHSVTPAYVLIATLMGLYIGYVFSAAGNLLVPIQLHFIYDLLALVYLKYSIKDTSEADIM